MRKPHLFSWGIVRHNLMFVLFATFTSVVCGATLIFSSGISGYSGNPATHSGKTCRDCHSGASQPTVILEGPPHTIAGRTYEYTLTISGGTQTAGGFDVSVNGGTLIATDAHTTIKNAEVVHTTPRSADANGDVSWFFDWTSPAAPGNTTMYGAGLSANLNGSDGGDNDNKDTLTIQSEICDHLVLDVNPETAIAGDAISFFTCGGMPGAPVLLVLVNLNGSPMFRPILVSSFDPSGQWHLDVTLPPGLAGLTATFTSFGIESPSGQADASNAEVIAFL